MKIKDYQKKLLKKINDYQLKIKDINYKNN